MGKSLIGDLFLLQVFFGYQEFQQHHQEPYISPHLGKALL
jgi:hypothetical protein